MWGSSAKLLYTVKKGEETGVSALGDVYRVPALQTIEHTLRVRVLRI